MTNGKNKSTVQGFYKSLYIKHSVDVTAENEFKHPEQSMERNAATFFSMISRNLS